MDTIQILILTYFFIFGLIFGSFFNVVILRPFSNESIVLPPSKCPKCNHKLAWYDNIPLFSFLILRAKCRYCKEPISWQYPFVEFLTGVMFVCSYLKFGLSWECLFAIIILSFFIIMSGTDFIGQCVYTMHFVPFIVVCVIFGLIKAVQTGNYLDPMLGLFIGTILMELYARSGYLFKYKDRVCGEGDSYIVAGIGAFLGLTSTLLSLVLAVLIQALWSFPMIITKFARNKKYSQIMTMFVFIFIVVSFCAIDRLGGFESFAIYLTYVLLMCTYAMKVCTELVESTKLEEGGISLPFGPAIFLGATLMIFFGDAIIETLRNIEWLNTTFNWLDSVSNWQSVVDYITSIF